MDFGKRLIVSKEDIGNGSREGEHLYDAYPNLSKYPTARPGFLFRDPIRVLDSWKSVGWTDVQCLFDCYTNPSRMLNLDPAPKLSCPIYKQLLRDPQTEVKGICNQLVVLFSEKTPNPNHPLGSSFVVLNDRKRSKSSQEKPLSPSQTVEASSSAIEPDVPYHGLLSNTEKDHIEEHLGRLYLQHRWQAEVLQLRAIFAEKTWIGFDLDDTLHEFRRSSGAASTKVLEEISKQYSIPLLGLKDEYARVLAAKTTNAFSDGKTSFDYRRERFAAVLTHFSLPQDDQFFVKLLKLYETTLTSSLELKCDALALLSKIKNLGKKILIITEGPQDAQERTIHALGIAKYIDFLATTNYFRVAKTSGLFAKVLAHLGISSDEMVYIGDSEERDMKPAMAEGIFSIHFVETEQVCLRSVPPRINTLRKLQYILAEDYQVV